ncbi:trichohyalin-like isoform X2 [Clytia hemisphaerica]|uniref:G domain-containing protein n=1 Tax=Clytia hemisphaerica TaxID=252671 RepID=A0A7M5XC78_9CNID|eukprot:TCONS_00068693-protein
MATNIEVMPYLLTAGNPGSGKSTILNCVMQMRNSKLLREDQKFLSGVSFGSGMTYQLDVKELNGIVYMDTPGLDDIDKRKQAAEAITQALKRDGSYQIIFVVTLESGRVKPADIATINLILDSAREITSYGVIFNKMSKAALRMLDKQGKQALLTQVSARYRQEDKPLPLALYLRKYEDLEDEENAVAEILELEDFLLRLPTIEIHSQNVNKIKENEYDQLKDHFQKLTDAWRKDKELMLQQMARDKEYFERKTEQLRVEAEQQRQRDKMEMERQGMRFQQQMYATQKRHEEVMGEAKRQRDEERERHKETERQHRKETDQITAVLNQARQTIAEQQQQAREEEIRKAYAKEMEDERIKHQEELRRRTREEDERRERDDRERQREAEKKKSEEGGLLQNFVNKIFF